MAVVLAPAGTQKHALNWKSTPGTRTCTGSKQCFVNSMTAEAIIKEIIALPQAERERVVKFVMEQDDSWIPDSFKRGMADADAGRFVDTETALHEKPPTHLLR